MKWYETAFTYAWIFNTGRGLSVCIRLATGVGIIYDLGCSDEFSPTGFIAEHIAPYLKKYHDCSIAQCLMSHPHADHIQEVEAIIWRNDKKPALYPYLVTCPNDKAKGEEVDFSRIITKDNEELIGKYRETYKDRNPPLQTIQASSNDKDPKVPNLEYGLYYMVPPRVGAVHKNDNHLYGNGLSLVLYLFHGKQSLLIPGDITPPVMKEVLAGGEGIEKRYTYFSSNAPNGVPDDFHSKISSQPTLKKLLGNRGLSVLVAPHHGLESCYSPELFGAIKDSKPQINVICEKRHLSSSDGKVDSRYQCSEGAKGLRVDIDGEEEICYSVSTRNGHHILIIFQDGKATPRIFLRKDPEDLLKIA